MAFSLTNYNLPIEIQAIIDSLKVQRISLSIPDVSIHGISLSRSMHGKRFLYFQFLKTFSNYFNMLTMERRCSSGCRIFISVSFRCLKNLVKISAVTEDHYFSICLSRVWESSFVLCALLNGNVCASAIIRSSFIVYHRKYNSNNKTKAAEVL